MNHDDIGPELEDLYLAAIVFILLLTAMLAGHALLTGRPDAALFAVVFGVGCSVIFQMGRVAIRSV